MSYLKKYDDFIITTTFYDDSKKLNMGVEFFIKYLKSRFFFIS